MQITQLWMNLNKLTLNLSKSKALCICSKSRSQSNDDIDCFQFGSLQRVESLTYLGVDIDSKLNFKPHLSKLQNKISKGIGILFKVRNLIPEKTLLTLYNSLIFPHLTYGILLWGSTFPSYLTSLQILQNKAIRAIGKLSWKERVTPTLQRLNILKVADIHKLEIAKFMHKYSSQSLPSPFSSYFTHFNKQHQHLTRTSNNFSLPLYSSSKTQRNIKFVGAKLWNSIPNHIRKLTYKKFTVTYKNFLTQQYE